MFELGLLGNALILLVALIILDKSSDLTINNSVKVAEITGLGKTTVGFLLVAFSTSLPELSVSIFSAVDPETLGVAIGNVLGSNIVNVCLILGLCFLILSVKNHDVKNKFEGLRIDEVRDLYFGLFIASLIPLALIYIGYASRMVGAFLIALFIFHNIQLFRHRKSEQDSGSESKKDAARYALLALLGVAGVVGSSYFIIESASYIASELGVPKIVIGATIVAFGTSLPELATSIDATKKGHIELALGNIVGSGFVNITLILGVALFCGPFRVNISSFSNLVMFSIMANLILWYFLVNERVSWRESAILLFMYTLFIVTSFGIYKIE
jgi:cation:H+ antiporter